MANRKPRAPILSHFSDATLVDMAKGIMTRNCVHCDATVRTTKQQTSNLHTHMKVSNKYFNYSPLSDI